MIEEGFSYHLFHLQLRHHRHHVTEPRQMLEILLATLNREVHSGHDEQRRKEALMVGVCVFVHTWLYFFLFFFVYVCLGVCESLYLFVRLSVFFFCCVFFCLYVCLFVCSQHCHHY